MMISPEWYYEENLKGKSAEQIMTAIRGLKQEIGRLKNTMEHPDYAPTMCPSESTRLWCTRTYLERAKLALLEAGGTYTPSKAEMKASAFEDNIPSISKVIFTIGGFFNGWETHTITLDEEHIHKDLDHTHIPKTINFEIESDYPMTKDEFLDGIRELHIGEWRKYYSPSRYGYMVLDGTQWELEIHFSNRHKTIRISGDNGYPYNFDEFKELMDIDYEEEECDEEDE